MRTKRQQIENVVNGQTLIVVIYIDVIYIDCLAVDGSWAIMCVISYKSITEWKPKN